jgi:hypothetical protein
VRKTGVHASAGEGTDRRPGLYFIPDVGHVHVVVECLTAFVPMYLCHVRLQRTDYRFAFGRSVPVHVHVACACACNM